MPAGIVTVTFVSCLKPAAGLNSSVLVPAPCQLPAIPGLTVGMAESAATGAEKWTSIGVVPLTPVALSAGLAEVSFSDPPAV